MPRKLSREALEAKCRELDKENHVLTMAFQALARGAVNWRSKKSYDGGRYKFGITNDLDNPILLIQYSYPGQRTTTTAYDYCEYKSERWPYELGGMTEFYRNFCAQMNDLFQEAEQQINSNGVVISDPNTLAGVRRVTTTPGTPAEAKALNSLSGCEQHPEMDLK